METTRKNIIQFKGTGSQLFAIDLLNAVLTILTLGLYYPWAKARKLKYLYQHTEIAGSPFDFLGTGREIFRGFIKAILILIGIMFAFYLPILFPEKIYNNELYSGIFAGVMLLLSSVVIPFFMGYAIFGTFRYRSARSAWRGILAGFDVSRKTFVSTYLKAYYLLFVPIVLIVVLVLIIALLAESFGIQTEMVMGIAIFVFYIPMLVFYLYATAFYQTVIYQLTYGNLRLGDLKLNFKGKAKQLFAIILLGGIGSAFTFGIYYFWFKRNMYNFLIENLHLEQNGVEQCVKSDITAGKVFRLEVGNILLILFTLGIGYSWAYCRSARFIANNVIVPEETDLDSIKQTEQAYTDATGEELGSMMDLGGIFF